jgi:magnesium transporter
MSNPRRVAAAEWIDLLDPDETALRKAVPEELHERVLAQLLRPAQHDDEPRPRIEGHDDYVYGIFLVPVCVREEDDVYYQEIDLVATRDRFVTVRKTPARGEPFDVSGVQEAADAGGADSVGELAYLFLDQVAEDYLDLIDALDDEIDELEDGIDRWPAEQVRSRISALRHDLLHVRRTLAPIRDAVHRVVDRRVEVRRGEEVFPPEIERSFGDVYDKLLRAVDGLDFSRDLLASARDYHQSKIANDQNEAMKTLTVIASLLLLPTFIVGVYGQNFRRIPELHWGFGYAWSWVLIIATTLVQLWFFGRKGWVDLPGLRRDALQPLKTLDPRALRGRRRRSHF